jgi:hypothetical protein
MASKILSDGQSARITQELVYNQRIALTAFSRANITEHPNLFYAVAIVQPGQTPAAAERALIAEFEKLVREPVTAAELQRAKNQFARDYILGRESVQDKALHLAHAAVIHDDITTADGEFDIFMDVTADEIQEAARTYFTERNRVVVHIVPRGGGRDDPVCSPRAGCGARGAVRAAGGRCGAVEPGAVPGMARGAAAGAAAGQAGHLPALRGPGARQRAAGRDGAPARAAGRHHAAHRPGRAAQDPQGLGGLAGLAANLLDQGTPRAAPSRSPTRSTRSAARWAPARGRTSPS